jgi:hypothetical protein
MSIALDSNGKIPFVFESGLKLESSHKAASAAIAAGKPVTLDSSGEYTVAADLTSEALLNGVHGILLNDIAYSATAFAANAHQGVTSRVALDHRYFSGCMAMTEGGLFRTTLHDNSMAVGDSVSWDGTEYVKAVAGSSDGAIGECVLNNGSGDYIRIKIRKHVVS